jgi:hypothetical protein
MLDLNKRFFCNDTGRIIVGNHIKFLVAVMNSKLFFFSIKNFYGGGALGEHGVRMKHSFFQSFPCLQYNKDIEDLSIEISTCYSIQLSRKLDFRIYKLYGLDDKEIKYIESQWDNASI